MGCCCSCASESQESNDGAAETEMREQQNAALSIARGMSAPSIDLVDRRTVTGQGLALVAVAIEQDSAYWEVEVVEAPENMEAMFGAATRKDRKFYKALEENDEDDSPEANGQALLRKCKVKTGDVVGVAIQQSDLPMIQISVNGSLCESINRYKGIVHPAVHLNGEGEGKLRFEFENFAHPPSSSRWHVMVARGLV